MSFLIFKNALSSEAENKSTSLECRNVFVKKKMNLKLAYEMG